MKEFAISAQPNGDLFYESVLPMPNYSNQTQTPALEILPKVPGHSASYDAITQG